MSTDHRRIRQTWPCVADIIQLLEATDTTEMAGYDASCGTLHASQGSGGELLTYA